MNNLPKGWELKYIEDIAEVKGGKRLPKGSFLSEDITPYPYIRVTNMYMGGIDFSDILYVPEDIQPQIKNYTISKNDLFISVAGTLGIVGEVPEELDNANLTENADKLTNIKINKKFLLYVLMSNLIQNEIKNQTTSNAQPKLALSRIKQFQIPVPPLEEQKKIADILSTVDKKIAFVEENINATEELKKGLMQKLLTEGIGHTEFKDSELGRIPESWEVVQLNDIFERVTRKNQESNDNALTISAQLGLVNQKKYFNKVVASKDLSNYYLLLKGEFAYNKSYSAGYPMGVIKRLDNYEKGVLSTLYICFRIKSSNIDTDYVLQYFSAGNFDKELSSIAQEGARNHGLLNVGVKEFFNLRMILPCMEEQKQIAEILSTVDKKIENLKEKKQSFEELKKGLMQKLLTGEVRV